MDIPAVTAELGAGIESVDFDEALSSLLHLILEHGTEHAKAIVLQILCQTKRLTHCPEIDIRNQSNEEAHAVAIYNICFNGGVYITKEYYASSMQPLHAVPLSSDLFRESVIVYRRDPDERVRRFIELLTELSAGKSDT